MQKKNQKGYTPIKDILVETFTELEQLYNQKQRGKTAGVKDAGSAGKDAGEHRQRTQESLKSDPAAVEGGVYPGGHDGAESKKYRAQL